MTDTPDIGDDAVAGSGPAARSARLAASGALAGAALLIAGWLVPFLKVTGGGSISILGGYQMPQKFWISAYPVTVAVLLAAAGLVLLLPRLLPRRGAGVRWLLPGFLIAAGIQAALFFAFYAFFAIAPDHHRWGGRIGVLGGAIAFAAGLVSRASCHPTPVLPAGPAD